MKLVPVYSLNTGYCIYNNAVYTQDATVGRDTNNSCYCMRLDYCAKNDMNTFKCISIGYGKLFDGTCASCKLYFR